MENSAKNQSKLAPELDLGIQGSPDSQTSESWPAQTSFK